MSENRLLIDINHLYTVLSYKQPTVTFHVIYIQLTNHFHILPTHSLQRVYFAQIVHCATVLQSSVDGEIKHSKVSAGVPELNSSDSLETKVIVQAQEFISMWKSNFFLSLHSWPQELRANIFQ